MKTTGKKPFLLIVGTMENMFYIIDSFVIIHEINVCYTETLVNIEL